MINLDNVASLRISKGDVDNLIVNGALVFYSKKTVTFNANGGTGTMAGMIGNTITLTTNAFTRTGYNFTGWNTKADGSGTSYSNGQTITLSSDITLYAQWQIKTYTIDFYKSLSNYAKEVYGATGDWRNHTGNQDIYGVQISTDGGATYTTLDTSYYRGKFSDSGYIKTLTVNHGTKLKVWVTYDSDYSSANASIFVDGVQSSGSYVEREVTITSNKKIEFQCILTGVMYLGGKSYWDGYVSTK